MSTLTKRQTARALEILKTLSDNGAPDLVTAREAVDLCGQHGVDAARWKRVRRDRYNFEPVSLAAVACEIAKKEHAR